MPSERPTQAGGSCPRLVMVCGHPRSGTTMLTQLLDSHPAIRLTHELRTFIGLGEPLVRHLRLLRKANLWRLPPVRIRSVRWRWTSRWVSFAFLACYAAGLAWLRRERVDLPSMRRVLGGIFPRAEVIGDKYPRYVFRLDRFAQEPDLLLVVIYRDARDVVRSAMEQSQRGWRRSRLAARMGSAAPAAKSWVRAIESMERHRDRVHCIRYEELVTQPEAVLHELGAYLGVDPAGFRSKLIRQDRVGKHKAGLSEADQATVLQVAGEAMRRLGYV